MLYAPLPPALISSVDAHQIHLEVRPSLAGFHLDHVGKELCQKRLQSMNRFHLLCRFQILRDKPAPPRSKYTYILKASIAHNIKHRDFSLQVLLEPISQLHREQ